MPGKYCYTRLGKHTLKPLTVDSVVNDRDALRRNPELLDKGGHHCVRYGDHRIGPVRCDAHEDIFCRAVFRHRPVWMAQRNGIMQCGDYWNSI